MQTIFLLVVYLLALVWPVKTLARKLGAKRSAVGVSALTIFAVLVAYQLVYSVKLGDGAIAAVATLSLMFLSGVVLYKVILDTSFLAGVGLALAQALLSIVFLLAMILVTSKLFPGVQINLGG